MNLPRFIIALAICLSNLHPIKSQNTPNNFKEKLDDYYLKQVTEKVYLHTDKDVYQLNDTLWFKAYMTKFNHVRSMSGKILTVSLFNLENEMILENRFKIFYGTGYGNLIIPNDIDDGDYTLVAYTDYMQNVDSVNIFKKTIRVFENRAPFHIVIKEPEKYYEKGDSIEIKALLLSKDNQPLSDVPLEISISNGKREFVKEKVTSIEGGYANIKLKIPEKDFDKQIYIDAKSDYKNYNVQTRVKLPIKGEDYILRFFPEGGDLVADLINRVAFEAYDNYKSMVDITGLLTDESGNTLDTIKTSYPGLGKFTYTPESGKKYFIKGVEPYASLPIELPVAKKNGVSVQVEQQDNKTVSAYIEASDSLKQTSLNGILYSGNELLWSRKINPNQGKQVFIPIGQLKEGIYQFTVLSDEFIPLAERVIYVPSQKRLTVSVRSNKKDYRPKDRVVLDVEVKDEDGNPVSANFSMAVVEEPSILSGNSNNILVYNIFEGELLEDVNDRYLLNDQKIDAAYADLLLMTKGWRRFCWEEINKVSETSVYDINKKYIHGTVSNFKGKPVKNANVQLFNPDAFKVSAVKTNDDGEFYFTAKDYLSVADTGLLVITASRKGGESNVNLSIDNNYNKTLSSYITNVTSVHEYSNQINYNKYIASLKDNDYYKDFDAQTIYIDEVSVTGKRRVKIDEATRKKVYHEISKKGEDIGVISTGGTGGNGFMDVLARMTTNFRVVGGKVLFRGYNSIHSSNQSGALIVINGIAMGEDVHILDNLNPNDIESVTIAKNPTAAQKYQGGSLGGLIEIKLKDMAEFKASPYKNMYKNKLNFFGINHPKQFYTPIYATKEDKLNSYDIRNTLYWNPDLRIDESGKQKVVFYTSDQKMKIKVVIEGMNFDQQAGRSETSFFVH